MKKFEENKAAAVDILTEFVKLATAAENELDLEFIDVPIAQMNRNGHPLNRLEYNLSIDISAEIFRFVDCSAANTEPEKMKKFEEDKAAIVDVLTDLCSAITAASAADSLKLAAAIGARVPDSSSRRKRGLYIRLSCDIVHFVHID